MNNKLWMVRSGEGGYLIDDFLEKKIIAIGWNDIGDLKKIKSLEEIKTKLRETYKEGKDGWINSTAGQIFRFKFTFKIGDNVLTYNSTERCYWVGEIISDYKFDKDLTQYYNTREVKWIKKITRDDLSTSTKNTLGSTLTIFELSDSATGEILGLLNGKSEQKIEIETKEESLADIKEDFIAKAHEFIKDKLLSLDWEEMQELVAGIIRSMGYKTKVSPKGADRGKDIIASPDGLGLEEPRIIIEVKHRQGQMGSQEIRSFLGGLRGKDKGLYVSTGGFSKEAKYEAERSNIPITLIDSDFLTELITQYYDSFDTESKTLIPLRKIYWPV